MRFIMNCWKKRKRLKIKNLNKKPDEEEVSSNFRKNASKCKTDPQNWEMRLKIEKQKKLEKNSQNIG